MTRPPSSPRPWTIEPSQTNPRHFFIFDGNGITIGSATMFLIGDIMELTEAIEAANLKAMQEEKTRG